jgi:transposase-like protein
MKPVCPRCKSDQRVIKAGENEHTFACLSCQIAFEDQDDGDIGRFARPDQVAERREEFALREKARQERRMRR